LVRGSEWRRRKYAGKIDAETIATRFEALSSHIRQGIATHLPALTAMEVSIKMLCEKYGIPTWSIPAYLNVGRELYRIQRTHTHNVALAESQLVANKWATRGLNTALIREICLLFGKDITPVSWY